MTDFTTKVQGIPCVCRVTYYRPYQPARNMSGRFEDAEDSIDSEFEFYLYHVNGKSRLTFLEKKLTDKDIEQLEAEYEALVTSIKHGMDF